MPDPRACEVSDRSGVEERLPGDESVPYACVVVRSTLFKFVGLTFLAGALLSCGEGPKPKMVASQDDGVPVNSAAEERLHGTKKPKPAPLAEAAAPPVAAPIVADVSPGGPPVPVPKSTDPKGTDPKAGDPKGTDPKGDDAKSDAKLTKAECKKLLDRYVALTISGDKRFPPEMVAQMKASALAQARAQKGDACTKEEISRPQYTCALAAASTAAWARCMKQ